MSVSTSRFPIRITHFICPSRANLKMCVYKYKNIVYCQLFPQHISSIEQSPEDIDLNNFPSKYLDLKDVKTRLSFSHLTDHTTAVLICSQVHRSPPKRLHNLSKPEKEATEKFINESLTVGLSRSFAPPVGPGFFCVGKKRTKH